MDLSSHFRHMATALFVGYKALLINETPVSCVIQDMASSAIVSIGYNYTNISLNGTKHAEFIAIARLMDQDVDFSKMRLYVTVEPCIMCASFLRQIGIGEVVYGCGNDRFGGNGTVLSVHRDELGTDPPYPSYGGVMRTEAIQLLRNFYIQENESAPVPKTKKNTEIESKLYPDNFFNLSEDEFVTMYGKERLDVFTGKDREITVKPGKGYSLQQFINIDELRKVPFMEEEMGTVDENQINEFLSLFYDIGDDGRVVYEKAIEKYNPKKRRHEE
ncbi:tRNA-specific adenosine deaminase subunit [Suhomyces tanzawaensis NRRL Y-17324]|uniref:tRNA-specific adenosine deaminase subunit n=1 Tax=Suhomyces tanzawaensis NRRL Y-17324 TaxID=984487 RepID=A0A1E4SC79_9ASCO|nr:tRNA-specific adenosine deaminase subunit [Suhomyces tanzawaensis NRRL Y-17324]ODV77113.1 tRNA-specific adenosine deaminase subunit [Suhomyces tanzawaensis NRRL Y-17324]